MRTLRDLSVTPRGGLSFRDNDDGNYVTDVTEERTRGTRRNDFFISTGLQDINFSSTGGEVSS